MDVAGLRPEASGSERGIGGAPAAFSLTAAVTSSATVRSVEMDLAVGESAGTSSPRPSGGENDEAKNLEEVSFIDGVLQEPHAEKVKAVLDDFYFEKGLGLDVGEEDLDTGYVAKGFCQDLGTAGVEDNGVENGFFRQGFGRRGERQLGQDVGAQRGKDKLDKVSLKKVVVTAAKDEVSVGGEAKVGEVLSEAAAP